MSNLGSEVEFQPSSRWNRHIAFTIDVEDYFMSPECIPFERWDEFPSRIHTGMERILQLLARYRRKATFFFVAWLAERYPEIVHWVVEQGHEVATHTYNHTFVTTLNQIEFEISLRRSLEILRDLAPRQPICGFRAPAFSLERGKPWQFELLKKHGIVYDSSINPNATYLYGDRTAPCFPYELHGIVEIPPATLEFFGKKAPVGGGGTLRLLPKWYVKHARRLYQQKGFPPVIYVHPWEFVPEHPTIDLPFKLHWMHWAGIRTLHEKVGIMLAENETLTMGEYYGWLMTTMQRRES